MKEDYNKSINEIITKLVIDEDIYPASFVFEGVIGQKSAVNKLAFFLSSHGSQNPIFPTMLFTGSHGLGKTYFAQKISDNLHRKFVEINAATIENSQYFVQKVLIDRIFGSQPTTILIDEAHSLKNDVTDVLLTLLSPNSTGKNYIKMNGHSIEYDMSKINMILATTDEYCIFKPLLNRTEKIYFDTYNCQEMLKMLKYYLPKINITCDTKSLAHACRGRGRDAYKLAKNIQRYCNIKNSSIFGVNDWEYLKSVLEIYPLGLNKQELEVLGIIGKMEPISASNIAIIMRTVEENVINELEVRLRELNLISTSSKGRFLTEDGKKYLCYARDKKECRKECD